MKYTKALVSVAAGLGLIGLALAGPASADTNVGNDTALVGAGSDTSQDVIEAFSNALDGNLANIGNITSTAKIENIKATGAAAFSTRSVGCSFTSRPNGSGDGLNGVQAQQQATGTFFGINFASTGATHPCLDFARSSSGSAPGTGSVAGTLAYIPFAVDELTYATLQTSSIPHNLNKNDLQAYYAANGTPGTAACLNASPLVPQVSSGTRKTFVTTFLGFSSNTITGAGSVGGTMGSCVKETNAANTPIEENDGRFLVNSKNLIPYSVGVWMAQASGVTDDIRGRASLGSVDLTNATVQGKMPMSINSNGVYDRLLYNVVPVEATTGSGTTAHGFNATGTQELFVGSSSLLCSAAGQKVVNAYGFGSVPVGGISGSAYDCGSVTKTN